ALPRASGVITRGPGPPSGSGQPSAGSGSALLDALLAARAWGGDGLHSDASFSYAPRSARLRRAPCALEDVVAQLAYLQQCRRDETVEVDVMRGAAGTDAAEWAIEKIRMKRKLREQLNVALELEAKAQQGRCGTDDAERAIAKLRKGRDDRLKQSLELGVGGVSHLTAAAFPTLRWDLYKVVAQQLVKEGRGDEMIAGEYGLPKVIRETNMTGSMYSTSYGMQ
ncbi:hypothetical protein TeGR_g6333, partial [Tetraparma gracilis]